MAKIARIWNGFEWIELSTSIVNYPDQTGNANKVLTTDGTIVSWQTPPSVTTSDSFKTLSIPNGTSPVADSPTDTLTLTESNGVIVTGDSSTDTINISTNATSLNTASTIISRDSDQSFDITGIDFDTTDTITSAVGRISWDSGEGTLSLGLKGGNLNLKLGQENMALCYNGTGSQINKGSVVYISGAQGQRPSIALADADTEATSSKTFGIVAENIANGAEGFVATFGVVPGLNTSGFTEGQSLWLSSTAGQLTNVMPTQPAHSVFVGYCLSSHASYGRIFVNPQNGYEIQELHDVLISDIANNHILSYDGTTSLWKNQSLYSAIDEIGNISISGDLSLAAGKIINIGGTPILSSTNYAGNANTVTNGVYTNGTYANPTFIESLEWSKITSTPTTLLGYGISDTGAAKTYLGLQNVENTALSTWAGSINITTLGTITSGTWNASVISETYLDASLARVNSPTFSGIVVLPGTTSIGEVTNLEISYLDGVTSSIQTQIDNKLSSSTASSTYAPIASPSFTGTVNLPSTTSIGDVSSTEISYLDGVTSSIQTQLNSKAPIESPTFTGTVSGITKTMVGLPNVDNTSDTDKPVSTAQQAALDLKSNLSGATFTGFVTLHTDPTQAMHAATKQYVDETAEGLQTKPSVEIATTGNLTATYNNGTNGVGATLTAPTNGAFPTIDDVTLASTTPGQNGVLVKNQSNPSENGRYNLTQVGDASNPWVLTRCGLCNEVDEIPGAYIFVKTGTLNAGSGWVLIVSDPATFTVGTDNISAFQFSGAGTITAGTNISVSGTQVSVVSNPTFAGGVTIPANGLTFPDGTQFKVGVPSISSFISKTASYTLDDLTLRDNIIEVDSASATTITIPPDSSLNLPVGSSLDVIQINTGEVTIAAGAGVTINSTPGLKLRTQWSSCTLLKRSANTWLVYGDLKA